MIKNSKLKKMGIVHSFMIYIPAALLMYFSTKYLIPFFDEITGKETIYSWFIVAGSGIFLPLLITAIIILKSEGFEISKNTWTHRLRFSKITKKDIIWSIGGLIVVGITGGILMKILEKIIGTFDHSPPFMSFDPSLINLNLLLAAWLPYWILNILGEEIIWRGVMLPRQEISFGKYAWLIHAFGWGLFHAAFGWQLLITLIPLIFIQSYVVQKTKNSWTGVIMHGGLNGPAFVAIAMGLI